MDYVRSKLADMGVPPGRFRRIGVTAALTSMALFRQRDLPESLQPVSRILFSALGAGLTASYSDELLGAVGIDPASKQGKLLTAGLAGGAFGVEMLSRGLEDRMESSLDHTFVKYPRLGTALLVGALVWAGTADMDWSMDDMADVEPEPEDVPEPLRELLMLLVGEEPSSEALLAQLEAAQHLTFDDDVLNGGTFVLPDDLPKIVPFTQEWPVHARWRDEAGNGYQLSIHVTNGLATDWAVWQVEGDDEGDPSLPEASQVQVVHDVEL